MTRKVSLVLFSALAIVLSVWGPAYGTAWIQVPVAGLDGYFYPGPDTTHIEGTFDISFDPSDILGATVTIVVNLVWPCYVSCGNGINGYNFFATMSTTSGEWFADLVYVDQRVSFVAYLEWQASGNATWEFLSGGSGAFVLSGFSRPLPDGCVYDHGSSDTTAEVIDAKIRFELRDPSPVEQSTWGRIKSLFSR